VPMRSPYTDASAMPNEHAAVALPCKPDTDVHSQFKSAPGLTTPTKKDNNPLINIPESACHAPVC
jgi:hypothetical protein